MLKTNEAIIFNNNITSPEFSHSNFPILRTFYIWFLLLPFLYITFTSIDDYHPVLRKLGNQLNKIIKKTYIQWGNQATHIPISYEELQRNKVLFSQLPFLDPLLQPHWTSSTNSLTKKRRGRWGGKAEEWKAKSPGNHQEMKEYE